MTAYLPLIDTVVKVRKKTEIGNSTWNYVQKSSKKSKLKNEVMFLGNELNKDNESVDNLRWQENMLRSICLYQNASNDFAILPSNAPL